MKTESTEDLWIPKLIRNIFVLSLLAALPGFGCAASALRTGGPEAGTPLFKDLGSLHLPVTTSSRLAQRYFDQGLRLTYAFNHDEAIRSFEEAVRLDPDCAMCYWGIALALGPNINLPMDPANEPAAYRAVQNALERSLGAGSSERAYIVALSQRYGPEAGEDRAGRDRAYADAMREVARRDPGDADAAVLFSDALMNLSPWNYWTKDGQPQPDTLELVSTLERVLKDRPDHPGACHLYIHAVEASLHPERALPCARRLPRLMPGAGHLVHMPAHIYMRVGLYAEAAERNVHAISADHHYFEKGGPQGFYRMMYYPHNIHFLWAAASMEGRSAEAFHAARELSEKVPEEIVRQVPELEFFFPTPLFALARFGKWEEILRETPPPPDFQYSIGMWRYARGLAFARTERLDEARTELEKLSRIAEETPGDRVVGLNLAASLLNIARLVLSAEVAAARGRTDEAVRYFEEAIAIEEGLTYDEPPPWYHPVRQSLGAVLLEAGRAAEAEGVYREDLRHHPGNGWSLYGLAKSLRFQKAWKEANAAEKRLKKSWSRADVTLSASRF